MAVAGNPSRVPSTTTQIFIGLLIGIAIGYGMPSWGVAIKPVADAFLRMIRMIIAPLLFATLVIGIAGTGDAKSMGRIALKAMIYFTAATSIALLIGLALVNIFQPGAGLSIPIGTGTEDLEQLAASGHGVGDFFVDLFPTSIIDAMARGSILQIVVFSVFFGMALAAVGERGRIVYEAFEGLAQVMFKFTGYVMLFAPFGVMAAIAFVVGSKGIGILLTLGKVVLVLYLGLAIFVFVVLFAVTRIVRVPFFKFVRAVQEPFLIAFTTASSEAALPKALEVMERFGVPKSIVSFVLPTGYSFNLDGTTLYLSLASIFVAQLAGIEMTIGQQVVMMLTLMITSKGVAGVPRAALVVLSATLAQFGLPLEGAAILLGIDQIMDMGRTSVNVLGNCLASVVVARWEGVFDDETMRRFEAAG